ncbi:hypothetical protein [Anaerosoma tenue]|uniref:hypothetical protein n=1 Tax=Anaerosoma tenue TaxID=2933588 RepID=UPI002260A7AF|nr:hypothetical protein [Anaerosoma tenue]MCK8114379.1 hypothetical protein [Anaerosoma tenue]
MGPVVNDGRLHPGDALFWAVSWGLGAALGVGLGGWLTLVGGAGAPGTGGLEPGSDLVALPLAAFGVVTAVHLGGQVVAAFVRGAATKRRQRQERDEDDGHDGVLG